MDQPDPARFVVHAELLTSVFCGWPSFHDAEVVSLHCDRMGSEFFWGPAIEAVLHVREMTSEVDSDGQYVLRNHVLVHFRFNDVDENQFGSFNHQNALWDLSISRSSDPDRDEVYDVSFESSYGLDGHIRCGKIEIISVTPCDCNGMPLGEER